MALGPKIMLPAGLSQNIPASTLYLADIKFPGGLVIPKELEGTTRYAGLLLGPAEGFGQGFFCLSGF